MIGGLGLIWAGSGRHGGGLGLIQGSLRDSAARRIEDAYRRLSLKLFLGIIGRVSLTEWMIR